MSLGANMGAETQPGSLSSQLVDLGAQAAQSCLSITVGAHHFQAFQLGYQVAVFGAM